MLEDKDGLCHLVLTERTDRVWDQDVWLAMDATDLSRKGNV